MSSSRHRESVSSLSTEPSRRLTARGEAARPTGCAAKTIAFGAWRDLLGRQLGERCPRLVFLGSTDVGHHARSNDSPEALIGNAVIFDGARLAAPTPSRTFEGTSARQDAVKPPLA